MLPEVPSNLVAIVAEELDSTQDQLSEDFLSSLPEHIEALLLVTRHQTAGHGREGRVWFSPDDSALAFSLAVRVKDPRPLGHWPLLIGWAKARTLASWVPFNTLDLKWPNDLLLDGKKVSGSLCSMHQIRGSMWVRMGIGINVGPMKFPSDLDGIATTLAAHTQKSVTRQKVLEALIDSILEDCGELGADDLLRNYAQASSIVQETPISWKENGVEHSGITRGLDADGALLCEEEGKLRPLHVSEISLLRPNSI